MRRPLLTVALGTVALLTLGQPGPGAAQAPTPTFTMTPSIGLVDRQVVTVEASGFSPGELVVAGQCRIGATALEHCQLRNAGLGTADASGQVSFAIVLDAVIWVSDSVFGDPAAYDCRLGLCRLGVAALADLQRQATQPLDFLPDAPLAPRSLTVSRLARLVDGEVVGVTGADFDPGLRLWVTECHIAADGEPSCNVAQPGQSAVVVVGPDGSFTTTYEMEATFVAVDGTAPTLVDCRLDTTCTIVVRPFEDLSEPMTGLNLHFAPNAPLAAPPVLTVSPSTGLLDGQTVTITGSGFRTDRAFTLLECAPAPTLSYSDCGHSDGTGVVVGPGGSFSVSMPVKARLELSWLNVDCLRSTCRLVAVEGHPLAVGTTGVDLHFDPLVDAVATGPTAVVEGSAIHLDASGSAGPSGVALDFAWSPAVRLDDPTSPTPTAAALDDGSETFTVAVSGTGTGVDTASVQVTTTNAAPVIAQASIAAPAPSLTASLTATVTDAGQLDTHAATVDWSDGTGPLPTSVEQGAGGAILTATHQYARSGRYVASLTVVDDDGGSAATLLDLLVGCTIVGTEGTDVLIGTRGNDTICAFGGNDLVLGRGGDDLVVGGAGRDILLGGTGDDVLEGDGDFDIAIGGAGTNSCSAEVTIQCSPPLAAQHRTTFRR